MRLHFCGMATLQLISDQFQKNATNDHIYHVQDDVWLRPLAEDDAKQSLYLIDKNRVRLEKWLYWVKNSLTDEDEIVYIKNARKNILENEALELGIFIARTTTAWSSSDGNDHRPKDSTLPAADHWKMIGMCGFISTRNSCGTLGYWIDIDYLGKGIITMACKKIIVVGFEKLGLKQFKISVEPTNLSSISVARRLGFETDGNLHKHNQFGKEVDVLYFVKHSDSLVA